MVTFTELMQMVNLGDVVHATCPPGGTSAPVVILETDEVRFVVVPFFDGVHLAVEMFVFDPDNLVRREVFTRIVQ